MPQRWERESPPVIDWEERCQIHLHFSLCFYRYYYFSKWGTWGTYGYYCRFLLYCVTIDLQICAPLNWGCERDHWGGGYGAQRSPRSRRVCLREVREHEVACR